MKNSCPNVNSKEWKNLVAAIGTREAMREFLERGEKVPTVDEVRSDKPQLFKSAPSIKPGVQELFESNPELANQVYEALGFNEQVINVPNKEVEFLLHSEKLKINLNEITLEEEGEIDLNLKNKWNKVKNLVIYKY